MKSAASKGYSEETCVRCGWTMGQSPLNCQNDDTPHRFPSQSESAATPCVHEWEYDEEESKGPWTGYIERCKHCGELQQVPQ